MWINDNAKNWNLILILLESHPRKTWKASWPQSFQRKLYNLRRFQIKHNFKSTKIKLISTLTTVVFLRDIFKTLWFSKSNLDPQTFFSRGVRFAQCWINPRINSYFSTCFTFSLLLLLSYLFIFLQPLSFFCSTSKLTISLTYSFYYSSYASYFSLFLLRLKET